jgi:hypothetical protein
MDFRSDTIGFGRGKRFLGHEDSFLYGPRKNVPSEIVLSCSSDILDGLKLFMIPDRGDRPIGGTQDRIKYPSEGKSFMETLTVVSIELRHFHSSFLTVDIAHDLVCAAK